MSPEPEAPHETGRGALAGVLILVLAGAALGIGYNALLLEAGPNKGLPWVRVERALASLEDLVAVQDSGGVATPVPPPDPTSTPPTAAAATAKPGAEAARPVAASPAPAPAPAAESPATGAPTASRVVAPVIPDMREPLEAKYEVVRALWDANAAVFVDARTAPEFVEERIARSVSLPLDDIGRNPELVSNFSSGGKPVVVYCGGGECELSKNLAWNLVDAGHKKVLVYLGGIAEWKQRGAPLTKGEAGGSR